MSWMSSSTVFREELGPELELERILLPDFLGRHLDDKSHTLTTSSEDKDPPSQIQVSKQTQKGPVGPIF